MTRLWCETRFFAPSRQLDYLRLRSNEAPKAGSRLRSRVMRKTRPLLVLYSEGFQSTGLEHR